MEFTKEVIETLESKVKGKIVYVTLAGSKLYGTDTETSDSDYKGIFIPSNKSLLLGEHIPQYTYTTGDSKSSNTMDDSDVNLQSIHTFFKLLKKSETGSVDMLFSMFRNDTIIYQSTEFVTDIKQKYSIFLNTNMRSFISYALGQTKKFGIKGTRYDELSKFVKILEQFQKHTDPTTKLSNSFDALRITLKGDTFKYIKMVMAPANRDAKGENNEAEYVSVLGKLFLGTVTLEYFYERILKLFNQFGNRTISTAKTLSKTDYKALSHSLRIAIEVEELLETRFIKFPLKDALYIKEIKEGKHEPSIVINKVQESLERVDTLLLHSSIQEECNTNKVDNLLLELLKEQNGLK